MLGLDVPALGSPPVLLQESPCPGVTIRCVVHLRHASIRNSLPPDQVVPDPDSVAAWSCRAGQRPMGRPRMVVVGERLLGEVGQTTLPGGWRQFLDREG